jgi:antitoxin component YwqK of YwqJK toxin-antitoxin module
MKTTALILSVLITAAAFGQDYNKVDANGLKQGVWKKPYEGTQVFRYVGEFKDDKPVGKFVYYYETGDVEAVIQFLPDGKTAYSQMYHESGYMMAKGKYINQLKDSTWIHFDDRGIVSYQQDYKMGKKDGLEVVYYEPVNGQYLVAKYANWKDDVPHGEFKTYHPNTQLASEGQYETGNLHGVIKYYHSNGRLMRVERYQYAVRHGYWFFYDNEGKQVGYKLYWEGVQLKGEALAKKEAELKQARETGQ